MAVTKDGLRYGRRGQPQLQLAEAEGGEERLHHDRIEVGAGTVFDDGLGVERRHRLAIGAIARQRVVDVGDGDDADFDWTVRVRGGLPVVAISIAVGQDDRDYAPQRTAVLQR